MQSKQNYRQQATSHIEPHILRKYNIIKKVGSGAYGHVWKVQDKLTKKFYALKKIFDAFQHSTDAQRTYRQIQILRQTNHPNIIKLIDTIRADNNKDVYLIFQFMEADLHNVIAEGILKQVHIKFIIYQIAKALKYLHSGKILHRDMKPSNILINSNCSIKICDFGLVRSLSSTDQNQAPTLTQGVATRWYRAPQVLMGSKSYSTPADIWSFGCIIYQILAQKPLFPGNSTSDQMDKILVYTGYPCQQDIISLESENAHSMLRSSKLSQTSSKNNILKDIDAKFTDILTRMLIFNPKKRIKIEEILDHQIVKIFRKKEEEIECSKIIKTSVDDNKKLTVQEYRNFIYGNRRAHTPNSFPKADNYVKKSNSYGKINSGSVITNKTSLTDKINNIKYVKSSKDIRPVHSYNKSSQFLSPQNHSHHYSSVNNNYKQMKNRILQKKQIVIKPNNVQKNRQTTSYQTNQTNPPLAMNSPKTKFLTGQNRPLFKSSKYILSKTQPNQKNYPQT